MLCNPQPTYYGGYLSRDQLHLGETKTCSSESLYKRKKGRETKTALIKLSVY